MRRSLLPFLVFAAACTPNIEDLPIDTEDPSDDDTTPTDDDTTPTDDDTTPTDDTDDTDVGDGTVTLELDATSTDLWVYVDVDAGEVTPESGSWSLAWKRSAVMTNGGVSGDGGVLAAFVDTALDDLTTAPDDGWTADAGDANDDGVPEYALGAWYDYDATTHVLTPKPGTWVLRTAGGGWVGVEIVDYYDAVGTSAKPTIRLKSLAAPANPPVDDTTLAVDASASDVWVYVSFDDGIVATPADPATSLTWDLALKRASIRVNGGYNGSGDGEVSTFADGTFWASVTEVPTTGWTTDVEPPSVYEDGTALAVWYDYNPTTHAVSPSGRVHAVRDADGDVWKLTVDTWTGGQFGLRYAPLGAP